MDGRTAAGHSGARYLRATARNEHLTAGLTGKENHHETSSPFLPPSSFPSLSSPGCCPQTHIGANGAGKAGRRRWQPWNCQPNSGPGWKVSNWRRPNRWLRLRADLKVARLDLRAAMRKDEPDAADVKASVAAVNSARSLILESRVNHRLKVNSILTPEQRTRLRELRRDRSGKGWGKMWRKGRYHKRFRGMGEKRPDGADSRPSSI